MTDKREKTAPTDIWSGLFDTWDQACKAAPRGAQGPVFDDDRWRERITRQLAEYRDEYREYGIAPPPRPSNLPWVCAMTSARSIVDFGGSSGWCWDYLQQSLPGHAISSYVVVELQSIVDYMTQSGLHVAPVTYKTITDSLEPCDLIYSNSVLQYFESNAPLLQLVERTHPEYILLEDIVGKGDRDVFSLQEYYGSRIPQRFIGVQTLIRALHLLGYRVLLKIPYSSPVLGVMGPLPMENFPKEKQIRYAVSLLLKKSVNLPF